MSLQLAARISLPSAFVTNDTSTFARRGLRVPPAGVTEELVDGVLQALRAVPELALADEDVAALEAGEDIRMATLGVRLRGEAVVMGREPREDAD